MTALAILKRDEIIERVAKGELVKDIAASFNISGEAISQQLAKDPQYQAARESGHEARLDEYQSKIDTADDALSLARAREGFRAQSWRAERECPKRWGAQQALQPSAFSGGITINIGNVQAPGALIDGAVVDGEAE